jgi:hypothetical protein
MNQRILIDFPAMAAFLGTSLHRLLRHKQAMKAAGVVEEHSHKGKRYAVALPDALEGYWRTRRYD